ncbi:MAG: helix-turn-helix domain-containing protein [Ruminococcaceae bacterium]|nr:helix-turn-helix domain-containing protein [Oscillospiraceae bacterium]
MKTEFGLWREQHDELFYKQYENPKGGLHFHSPIELYIVDEGELDVWINDKYARLKKGEISVALSYDSHYYSSSKNTRASLLIIPTHMCKDFLDAIKNKRATSSFIRDPEAAKRIRACYDEIIKDSGNNIKTLGYIYVILGIVMESISFEQVAEKMETQLSSRILLYINEHFKEDISLNSISAVFGYNPSYISRYFKSCFKIGINRYLTIVRLKEAILLMQKKGNSITYCAFESGFNSMRTFYRSFYNEFQCTPGEYMAQLTKGEKI